MSRVGLERSVVNRRRRILALVAWSAVCGVGAVLVWIYAGRGMLMLIVVIGLVLLMILEPILLRLSKK